ncbi:MAG TPA: PLP-dependent aminotransferase family protein [Candidatus Mucispirillum faecigallinarum]|uniref:PLP-dependent aminotransferase family protein n=1 Tax=Candidatus Mucispirillum faecigallinarum TaxID=2838699 RepID=A0A9D2KCD1_9BACT|nr:PLP-dependent aminotransferase family protein [Candidatus Mucispirillum faecigallinarum]
MYSHWKLEGSGERLYLQIADIIIKDIENGRLKPNTRLPSQRKLCEIFNVSRNTIIMAIEQLIYMSYVEVVPQSGIFVKNIFDNEENHSPNWDKYFSVGMHKYGNIKRINQLSNSSIDDDAINISAAGLGKDFNFLASNISETISKICSKDLSRINHFNKYGYLPLRKVIAERISMQGKDITSDNILIIPSVLHGINLSAIAFLSFASNFIYATPNVINMDSIVHYTGVNMIGIEQDREGINIEKLKKQLSARNTMIYLNSTYHNPTGINMGLERKKAILSTAAKYRIPIMEVDSMRDIWFDKPHDSSLFALDKNDSVIYFGSLLRTLTINLGISWIAAPKNVIEKLSDVKAQHDIYPSMLLQMLVTELMTSGVYDSYLEKVRSIMLHKRELSYSLLRKYLKDDAEWDENNSDFYIWLKFKNINTKKLFEVTNDVLFYPGFFFNQNDTSHISICNAACSDSELEEGLIRLKNNINKLK